MPRIIECFWRVVRTILVTRREVIKALHAKRTSRLSLMHEHRRDGEPNDMLRPQWLPIQHP